MKEMTVSEVFASNDKVYEKLRSLVAELTVDQASRRDVSQDKWSVAEIVEHVSIVEAGIAGLCARLLTRSGDEQPAGDGRIRLSDAFLEGGQKSYSEKWQAPERVRPTGTKTIAKRKAHIVSFHDLADFFEVRVEKTFLVMREAPLRHN